MSKVGMSHFFMYVTLLMSFCDLLIMSMDEHYYERALPRPLVSLRITEKS